MKGNSSKLVPVGDDTFKVEGNISSSSDIAISGTINGNIRMRPALLVINNDCLVTGDIEAGSVEIKGKVVGNINASSISICSTGVVNGDIHTVTLRIDEGGILNGKCETEDTRKQLSAE